MARKKKQLTLPHVPESTKGAAGNPIVAFRCERSVVRAFVKKHGGKEAAWTALRRHMQASTRKDRAAS